MMDNFASGQAVQYQMIGNERRRYGIFNIPSSISLQHIMHLTKINEL